MAPAKQVKLSRAFPIHLPFPWLCHNLTHQRLTPLLYHTEPHLEGPRRARRKEEGARGRQSQTPRCLEEGARREVEGEVVEESVRTNGEAAFRALGGSISFVAAYGVGQWRAFQMTLPIMRHDASVSAACKLRVAVANCINGMTKPLQGVCLLTRVTRRFRLQKRIDTPSAYHLVPSTVTI